MVFAAPTQCSMQKEKREMQRALPYNETVLLASFENAILGILLKKRSPENQLECFMELILFGL